MVPTHHHVRVVPLPTVFLPLYRLIRIKAVGAERDIFFPNVCFTLEVTNSLKLIGSRGDSRCAEVSKTHPPSFMPVSLVEGSLLLCTCLVSGWHKLWAFTRFFDNEDDTTPDFRCFSISHQKQIVNCR
jgi:hypothetical protein